MTQWWTVLGSGVKGLDRQYDFVKRVQKVVTNC